MSPRILDAARTLQRRGLVNFVAVSSHNRALAATLAASGDYDIVHLRYSAVHPGAELRNFFPRLPAEGRPGVALFTGTSWGQLLDSRLTPAGERTPAASDCYRFVLSIRASMCARPARRRPVTSRRPSRRANSAPCRKRNSPG